MVTDTGLGYRPKSDWTCLVALDLLGFRTRALPANQLKWLELPLRLAIRHSPTEMSERNRNRQLAAMKKL